MNQYLRRILIMDNNFDFDKSTSHQHSHSQDKNLRNGQYYRGTNGFFFFILSFLPGAAHMYLGLMELGIQRMVVFFGTIALTNLFANIYLPNAFILLSVFSIVIVWFYSFFDGYDIRGRMKRGEHINNRSIEFSINTSAINNILKTKAHYIGAGFIAVGLISLINIFPSVFLRIGLIDTATYRHLINMLRGIGEIIGKGIIPVVLIIIGSIMIKRSGKGLFSGLKKE